MCEHTFVRWDALSTDADAARRLPGYRDEAVVRTFDAPEALDIRFYEVVAKSALNRVPKQSQMPFRYTINPYRGCTHACLYCFARPTHTYLDFDARRDFEREIVVKVNVPEVLRAELARPSWKREHVALGTNTDPYQWVESRYRVMEGIWEALRDASNPCSVLTKSPLLLRDLPLMLEIAERTSFSACLSIPTLDEKAWRATEPHTRARERAWTPSPSSTAPASPRVCSWRRSCRASTTPPSRWTGSSSSRPRRGPPASAASPSICAARCATSSSTGCAPTGRISSRATRSSTGAAPTLGPRSGGACRRSYAGTRGTRPRRIAPVV